MGTNCEPLVPDLFLFCYEKDFMMSFSADKDAEIIEAFSSTSRYLDGVLNVDNTYFERYGQSNLPIRTSIQLGEFIRYWGPVSGFTFDFFRWFCYF